jgi:hypothetical protein
MRLVGGAQIVSTTTLKKNESPRKLSGARLPTDIPLNCPKCGAKLVFIRADEDVSVYQCANDGMVLLPPNGRLRVVVY